MVRVANTGRSEWIDAAGRIRLTLESDRVGVASFSLSAPPAPISIYARGGDACVVALALFVPAVFGLRSRRGRGVGFQGRKPALSFFTTGEFNDAM